MRTTFINTLLDNAKNNRNIFLLTADLGFKVFDEYRKTLPEQFVNMGVAEQNMVSVATGMALSGKKVYCYSMVPFLTMRAFEQIRVDVCNHKLNVTLVGVGGGLSYGMEGMTHHGFEDISIMRTLPGMTVTAPGDPVECAAIIEESISYKGPLFVRLGKNNDPVIHGPSTSIRIGKGVFVREGADICVIGTGSMLPLGAALVDDLKAGGISAAFVSMHTIKPLDEGLLKMVAEKHKGIFTIEEHSIIGGLGSAVSEYLSEAGYRGRFKRIGLPDRYCQEIGDIEYLRDRTGLTPAKMAGQVRTFMK